MIRTLIIVLTALTVVGLVPLPCGGQDLTLPAEQHPWGRFPVNSWKSVRVVSELLDEHGNVGTVTVTDTKTTLIAADKAGYSLRIDSTVEVAGKRFASQPQIARHGYNGESAGQTVKVKKLGDAELVIDGKAVPTELREAVFTEEGTTRVSTIHYSRDVSPFVLRRETRTDGVPEAQANKTLVETISLELPHFMLGKRTTGVFLKTTRQTPQGTKVTLEVLWDAVPGGVVEHWASETDASNKTVRRSVLELVDYGVGARVTTASPVTMNPATMNPVTTDPATTEPTTQRKLFNRQRPRRMK
jgi:hypothetical protein